MAFSSATVAHAHQLVAQRDQLEKQIKEVNEALMAQKNVGMDGHLLDRDGFPRDDIDVYQVRTLRHEMARLLFDHKELTKQIEAALSNVHEEQRSSNVSTPQQTLLPYAIVQDVAPDSPAHKAGLVKGDLLIRYGHVDAANHRNLQALAELTAASEDKTIMVVVERLGSGRVDLLLTPGKWNGRGLLGCLVLPYKP